MYILGVDQGEKRIGLAIADAQLRLVSPLGVLERRSRAEDFARLAQIVRERQVGLIVVGQPLAEDGGEGQRARSVRRWAEALAEALGAVPPESGTVPASASGEAQALRIVLWDERLSTVAAADIQRAQGKRGSRRTPIDAMAAAVILQDYLDSQPDPNKEE